MQSLRAGGFATEGMVMPSRGPLGRFSSVLTALACLLTLISAWPQPASAVVIEPRGVAIDIVLGEPVADELGDVDAAAALGADSVRVSVQWAGMEPLRKGQYASWYLDRLDAVVARADARGVKVLLAPVFSPCWAVPNTVGVPLPCLEASLLGAVGPLPPDDPRDYADFASFLAARYDTRLAGLEVWNEPNLPSFWNTREPAAAYVRLLRATYGAVKRASPAVPVVAGSVAGTDAAFLDALYDAGIQGSYDVLSVHPYNDGRAPAAVLDPRWSAMTFLQGLRNVRDVRAAHGDRKPAWLTELGWNTSTQRGELWLDGVTLAQQAEYLTQALAMLRDPAWGIDFTSGVFVYRLRDTGTDAGDPQQGYGLQRYDGTAKPAFAAVKAAFRWARPTASAAGPTAGTTGRGPTATLPTAAGSVPVTVTQWLTAGALQARADALRKERGQRRARRRARVQARRAVRRQGIWSAGFAGPTR